MTRPIPIAEKGDAAREGSRGRGSVLPSSCPPRGLSRLEAAAYVGVSASKFDELVRDGRMPKPKRVDGRVIWDRLRLDVAFGELPDDGAGNPWDDGDTA